LWDANRGPVTVPCQLYASFLELDDKGLRRGRARGTPRRPLRQVRDGLRPSDQVEADGATVYRLACELGAEGIISKLKGSRYRSGRTRLGQGQEPGLACGQARVRGGVG
jgi:hypothetical protein